MVYHAVGGSVVGRGFLLLLHLDFETADGLGIGPQFLGACVIKEHAELNFGLLLLAVRPHVDAAILVQPFYAETLLADQDLDHALQFHFGLLFRGEDAEAGGDPGRISGDAGGRLGDRDFGPGRTLRRHVIKWRRPPGPRRSAGQTPTGSGPGCSPRR